MLGSYQAGTRHSHLACPKCQGGNNNDKDLTVYIESDGRSASWFCFRASCNWKGRVPSSGSHRAARTSGPLACMCAGVAPPRLLSFADRGNACTHTALAPKGVCTAFTHAIEIPQLLA